MKKKHILLLVIAALIVCMLFYFDISRRTFTTPGIISNQLLSTTMNVYYMDKVSRKIEVAQEIINCTEIDLLASWRRWNGFSENEFSKIEVSQILPNTT